MSQVSHSPKCYALLCTSVDVSAALSWLPRMLRAKISASLELFFRTCLLYLQSSAPSRLLLSSAALVFFCFRTLLSSEPDDVFTLLSQKLDWLACATHHLLYVFRLVRVVRVYSPGSPGNPGSPDSPGSLAGIGLILGPYHGTTTPEILHPFPSIWTYLPDWCELRHLGRLSRTDYITRMVDWLLRLYGWLGLTTYPVWLTRTSCHSTCNKHFYSSDMLTTKLNWAGENYNGPTTLNQYLQN